MPPTNSNHPLTGQASEPEQLCTGATPAWTQDHTDPQLYGLGLMEPCAPEGAGWIQACRRGSSFPNNSLGLIMSKCQAGINWRPSAQLPGTRPWVEKPRQA